MGIFADWDAFWEAKEMVRKYNSLINYLDGKISELNNSIEMMENALISVHETLTSNSFSAWGLIRTTFEIKEMVWDDQRTTIINNMKLGVVSLEARKTEASIRKAEWEARVSEIKGRE